jgi:uncharacterized protein (TIRG00374 family)
MQSRRIFLALAGVTISVLSVYVLLRVVDIRATADLLARTDPTPILGVIAIVLAELVLRSVRWRYLLPSKSGDRVPARRLLPVLLVGYLGNIVLPARLGEAVRAVLVSRREQVTVSAALGSVLLERVLDLASLAAIAWVAATLARAPDWMIVGTGTVALIGGAVAAALVFIDMARLAEWIRRVLAQRWAIFERAATVLRDFAAGAGGQPRRLIGVALVVSATCWFLDATGFYLVSIAIGAPIPWASCLLIAAVTVLGTAIPSAPGYVGTFELAAVAAGAALGLPNESVLAMAILSHALTTGLLAIGGIAVLIATPIGAAFSSAAKTSSRSTGA